MSKILIVEDNVKNSYLLEQFLLSKGHQVNTAENGVVALASARQDLPELIISDIMMPEMNGFRLCREIKNDPELKEIPIIFYTATFIDKEDERLALSLGASRFLVKPVPEGELEAALAEVLNESREESRQLQQRPQDDVESMLDMYDNSITRKLTEKVEQLQEERKSLSRSEQRLKEAQEIAQVGHWEFSLKTGSAQWSDEVCRIFGLKPRTTDLSHEVFLDMVCPEDHDLVEKSFRELLVQMAPYDITYCIQLPGDSRRFVHERGQILCDDVGLPIAALGTIQNITEQKVAEIELTSYRNHLETIIEKRTEELQQTQDKLVQKERLAVLGQLATTVSHELRNPLGTIGNAIYLMSEALKQDNLGNMPAKLELAHRNVIRCDRIINELLDFANGNEPHIKTLQFDAWLQDVTKEIDWPEEIRCELLLATGTTVSFDPALMYRAINNVVINAIQAFESVENRDKVIQIATSIAGTALKITIKDNGSGMDRECLEQIYDTLFSTKPFGIGLGMAIVKNSVESLNGSVTVESQVGVGTTATITIPL